jgi:serine/threonine-protein kinase
VLCERTPCKITWYGDGADEGAKHELTFEKKGFKTTTVPVLGAEPKVHAKLEFAPGAGKPKSSVPTGYKDAY